MSMSEQTCDKCRPLPLSKTVRLCAKHAAAPDLYDQLKTLLKKWESIDESSPVPDELNDTDNWSWDEARAAIAKAEGK